jgi:glutamine amidotransferase
MRIAILDYGAGNIRSVERAVGHAGYDAQVTSHAVDALAADALILPGVGAAANTMEMLRERRLVEPIREAIDNGVPFLGVCMGLQALFDYSEEGGQHDCLGVMPGRVRRITGVTKIPHMGWNTVRQTAKHPVFEGIPSGAYFYFVHSYCADPQDGSVVIGETEYGIAFPSVVARGNLVATQFHPEKSGDAGLRLYANFLGAAQRLVEGEAAAFTTAR